MNQTSEQGNIMISWIALIVAILALIVGWIAYNRTGVDLETQIQREVNQAAGEANQELNEAEREVRDETSDTLESQSRTLEEGAADVRTDEETTPTP